VSAVVVMMIVSRDFPLFMIVDYFVRLPTMGSSYLARPLVCMGNVANNIRKHSAFDTVLLMFFAANTDNFLFSKQIDGLI
jgi:hypothetical protein